jgi:tetratricopeptide (TPR) repeat protein
MIFSPFPLLPRLLSRGRDACDPARRRRFRSQIAALVTLFAFTILPAVAVGQPGRSSDSSTSSSAADPAGDAAPSRPRSAHGIAPPSDLSDLAAWLDYKRSAHIDALPDEARLFYRRGLLERHAGHGQQATRLVRGAAELDPGFVRPHLTLAAWLLTRDPSQALLRYVVVLELVRRSFLLQIELATNLLFFTMHGLFVGLLATCLVVLLLHNAELRHMWQERLSRFLSPTSAAVWAWAILLVPFAAGLGLALPAVVFLGLLWPLLRARERTLFVAMLLVLACAPLAGRALGRLAAPLSSENAPLYGIAALQDEAWTPSRQTSLERLAAEHPDNAFVQFGLGWSARKGRDLATAEAAYRHTLALQPQDARVMNNLANVLVEQGRLGAAIELYRSASTADPENAAAQFNLSQIYTRQFEYRAASEASARASALDFELVKSQQALGTEDGVLPLADQWIAPATCWNAALDRAKLTNLMGVAPALPAPWYGHVEVSGWPFAALTLVLALGSVLLGVRWQRAVPLRPCRNCGRVVCRRCSQRRRELALCPACAEQESHAESPEFARVLLARQRGRRERVHRLVRTVLATIIPGYGLLSFHRVFRATALIIASALLCSQAFGLAAPLSYQAAPGRGDGGVSPILPIVAWLLIYANSLLGYLSQAARAAAHASAMATPVRSRPTRADHPMANAA